MKKIFLFLLMILMCGWLTAPLSAQNCDPITVTDETPWFEDFEGYTGSGEQPFQCWIPLVTDATYNGPFVYCGWGASCHSGANSAEMKGASNLLILPDFTNDITTLRLSFWAQALHEQKSIQNGPMGLNRWYENRYGFLLYLAYG